MYKLKLMLMPIARFILSNWIVWLLEVPDTRVMIMNFMHNRITSAALDVHHEPARSFLLFCARGNILDQFGGIYAKAM